MPTITSLLNRYRYLLIYTDLICGISIFPIWMVFIRFWIVSMILALVGLATLKIR